MIGLYSTIPPKIRSQKVKVQFSNPFQKKQDLFPLLKDNIHFEAKYALIPGWLATGLFDVVQHHEHKSNSSLTLSPQDEGVVRSKSSRRIEQLVFGETKRMK